MSTRELLVRAYDPRNATDEEYAALHQFFAQVDREERPLDPPVSLSLFVNQRRHLVLPRSLTSRPVTGAAFKEERLRVAFGDKEAHDAS